MVTEHNWRCVHYKPHSDNCNYQQKCGLLQGGCEDSTSSHCTGNEDLWGKGNQRPACCVGISCLHTVVDCEEMVSSEGRVTVERPFVLWVN